MIRKTALIATSVLACQMVHAEMPEVEPARKPFQFLMGAGLTFGGDNLLDVEYENGISDELEMGGLMDIKAGLRFQPADSPLVLQSTFGYHFDRVSADNGDADLTRTPFELLGFYKFERHMFGGGVTHHMNVKAKADINIEFQPPLKFDYDMDDATGYVLEYGFEASPLFTIAVRFVNLEYESEHLIEPLDATHGGIYGYFHF